MKKYRVSNSKESVQRDTYLDAIQSLSESTDDYLFLWEIASDRIYFFGGIAEKYNLRNDGTECYTLEEWKKIVYPEDLAVLTENLNLIVQGKITDHNLEYRLIDRQGKVVWVSCRGKVKVDETSGSYVLIGRVSDTALRYKVDALTGMFNMPKMMEDIEHMLSAGRPGFLLILGVDNLKNTNIKYGRKTGDRVLKFLKNVLEEAADLWKTYRLNQDCFAVCLPDAVQTDVQALYNRVQEMVSMHFTVSGGAVSFRGMSGRETEKLYQYAEYALDKAKNAGKNRLEFFESVDYEKKVSSIELMEELENSVKHGYSGFSLVYQPQIKEGNYQLFGAEALLRYESSVRGRVMPNDFVPLLEQTGLICDVGLWVLRTALKQCREWRKKMPEFHISVNVSYVQLTQGDIMEKVLEELEKSGLPGEALTLEVTESMQLQNLQYYNKIFSEWKKAGIKISVDDFGTGYSSLGYLKQLEIDEIKIDRCFVSGIQNSSYNYRLLCNMMELAAGAQIQVCCEGVEEKEELQTLEELKPDLLQGYLFSKPCDIKQFERIYFDSTDLEYQEYQKRMGQVQKKRFGKLLNLRQRDILRATNLGVWIICIDTKRGCSEMYADETMIRVMGADKNLTQEECYRYWYERIAVECREYVNHSVERMISHGGVVQIQYKWNHPEMGKVEVCCTGIRTEDIGGMICLEGYHRMVSDIEMTSFEGINARESEEQ